MRSRPFRKTPARPLVASGEPASAEATLADLTAEAMRLRRGFAAAALSAGRKGWTREQVMQGFVGDVGDLMKLVMAKGGAREITGIDRRLGHELADCLWSILVLARLYQVDLAKEFFAMTAAVSAKLAAHRQSFRRRDARQRGRLSAK